MRVREKLLNVVRRLYPSARLIAVGSTINGCGAYNSDMDLCMCLPDPHRGYHTDREYGIRILKKVHRELAFRSNGLVRMATFIPAKVPIIKLEMEAPFDELEVDINCNNVPGIYNSHLLHYYSRIDDRFPALCLLVKHWAINARINDAMNGTFNSYSLILLVLHFLQCVALPPVLPNLQALFPDQFNENVNLDSLELFKELRPLPSKEVNTETVGELLVGFFNYYSQFNFTRCGISVCRASIVGIFFRSELPSSDRRYKIFIEEPYDLQNTARCVTRIENLQLIQHAFSQADKAFLGSNAHVPASWVT
ncbi:unnamed protein product [Enterobius vermicularis]|uniref:PAP-associated domain-containing protein n=1 Tax=Enterobius vermicularis TaxID=51028 RepID=A0A0N4V8J3_ENTVE|nr:unnamed protein product [Enterobius vermicularis]